MQIIEKLTLTLIVVGAVNWGLVGLAGVDLVSAIFGAGSFLARAVFILVGLSGLYQAMNIVRAAPHSTSA